MTPTTLRIGHGYDLHRLDAPPPKGAGKPMVLGGLTLDHPRGPIGHSDGDAVLHAVTDAILGAIGQADIGQLFPDNDPQYQDADSGQFLRAAVQIMRDAGFTIGNLDVTVVCESPKIGPIKEQIIENLARMLDCDFTRVNVKGKTREKLGAVGKGRAIEVHAVVLVVEGSH